ncbi:MAG TPA: hypothetical protein PLI62_17155 [Spirochaetota bacterium]|nr:hypothetical protein [Spirochaetota bacterium]
MIKDFIFYTYGDNLPEELKPYINETKIIVVGTSSVISCNYLNGRYINITIVYDFNKQQLNENISLMSILNRIKPLNLFEIALCLKMYNYFLFKCYDSLQPGNEEEYNLRGFLFDEHKYIDEYSMLKPLLADSRGWLVWKYQLFHILSLAVERHDMIELYIKGLNTKRADVINEINNIRINDFYLYDAIQQLSLPGSSMTYSTPNLRDALIINNELKLF